MLHVFAKLIEQGDKFISFVLVNIFIFHFHPLPVIPFFEKSVITFSVLSCGDNFFTVCRRDTI